MEGRVLIHAPRGRDATVVQKVLGSRSLATLVCASADQMLANLDEGAAAAIMTEESLLQVPEAPLSLWLTRQPSWSDFPFIVLASRDANGRSRKALALLQTLGNVFVLERPVHAETLARAADAAVRARRRQYATRLHLQQLEDTRAEVERLNGALEERIVARTRELAGANDRLMAEIAERERAQAALIQVQKMEAIGRLTGGIAHDFNNLLHVVNMNLDLVSRVASDEKVLGIAARAKGAVGRGAKLTGQLLSFARNQSLLPRLTDVNVLLDGLRELVAVSVGPAVTVDIRPCDEPAWAVLDANQLEMAVLNLAVNARDAMSGGGTLSVAVSVVGTAGADLPPGPYVAVSVSDTGTGIPLHLLSKVFDPFFTTKPVGSGTGLGLSQVYGFAQQSGGVATVRSEEGRGTVVEMRFPASSERNDGPDAVSADSPQASAQRQKVLVIEDDAEVRRAIVESLSMLGYVVSEAANGATGLAALAQEMPDLLVVDYAMPDMNGAEVIDRAREHASDIPVILATGYADMAEVGRVLGTQSILIKPFDISTLAAAVSKALQAR
ncbi:response regulator [Variovorax sp. PAMC 28711]|uniref:response regulator n=1 Tax=Variovorax sp. PAMC 28711 TaxID=1795631 RepID=UPI00078D2EF3|nr:response regulator [Variovorax sp. PAMC 28711]AMM25168.1 hybrid sensor histidine kinase/response regulator [Variovorax sp. PAMC 28711]